MNKKKNKAYLLTLAERVKNGEKLSPEQRHIFLSNNTVVRNEVRGRIPMNIDAWFELADKATQKTFGVSLPEACRKTRVRDYTDIRKIVMHTAYFAGYPSHGIGQRMGKRDHATVLHGRRMYEQHVETDSHFKAIARAFVENIVELEAHVGAYSLSLLGLDKEYELEPLTEIHSKRTARVV
jgi:hypothetical protein